MENLTQTLSGLIPDAVIAQITDDFQNSYNCNTPLRLAHFLSQCAHESNGFNQVFENLYYNAQGLCRTFPSLFTNEGAASVYAMNPVKIGNKIYANRMGNGDEASGDGYKYRGRGYIQLTGKENYEAFNKTVPDDVVSNPDLVGSKYPLASAGFFFNNHNLWAECDLGADTNAVIVVTRRVNGGVNGLTDRQAWFDKIWRELQDI